jgi:hypothetical protein
MTSSLSLIPLCPVFYLLYIHPTYFSDWDCQIEEVTWEWLQEMKDSMMTLLSIPIAWTSIAAG